jgi:hypothetical protein
MVTNANAGLRWLNNKTPNLDEVRAAMHSVVSAGHRASEVMASIRAMFRKDGQDETTVDLDGIIQDVLGLVHGELQAQGIIVQIGLTKPLPLVLGHSGQLQQVIFCMVGRRARAALGASATVVSHTATIRARLKRSARSSEEGCERLRPWFKRPSRPQRPDVTDSPRTDARAPRALRPHCYFWTVAGVRRTARSAGMSGTTARGRG